MVVVVVVSCGSSNDGIGNSVSSGSRGIRGSSGNSGISGNSSKYNIIV